MQKPAQAAKPKPLARQETKTSLLQRLLGRRSSGQDAGAAAEAEADIEIPVVDEEEIEQVEVVPQMHCGHSSTVGHYHPRNEDTFNVLPDLLHAVPGEGEYYGTSVRQVGFFAVFDGHGGHACSHYAREKLHSHVARRLWRANHHSAFSPVLHQSFIQTDKEFCKMKVDTSGSCSTCVLVKGNKVFCANAGDSKAMLIVQQKNGRFEWVDLCQRHSSELHTERARILKAGGTISSDGRVYGVLAPSRAFGDIDVKVDGKPVVIATPEGAGIHPAPPHVLDPAAAANIIVLATDGLWDFVPDDAVAHLVMQLASKRTEQEIADALGAEARCRGSDDDVTVLVVRVTFPEHK